MVTIREYIKKSHALVSLVHRWRSFYRRARTRYLVARYPGGGFLNCNGIRVFCDFHDESYAWYDGNSRVLALDQKTIKSVLHQTLGNVFIDLGAHVGFYTRYLSETIPTASAKIIALEPDPKHYRCLQNTMSKPTPGCALVLLPYAIASENGNINLFKTDSSCLHTYHQVGAQLKGQARALTLDALADEYLGSADKIALIKIDVDGAERQFFAGGENTLDKHRPVVLMEFAPSMIRASGGDAEEFFHKLHDRYEMIYMVSYQRFSVRRIFRQDFENLEQEIGEAIADFILSHNELTFGTT